VRVILAFQQQARQRKHPVRVQHAFAGNPGLVQPRLVERVVYQSQSLDALLGLDYSQRKVNLGSTSLEVLVI